MLPVRRAWASPSGRPGVAALRWHDVVVFASVYALTASGVTVGFHRHFTHRSFKTRRWVRGLLAVLGSAAIEGPVISWVADHRKHHAFSDRDGDPHSPHVGHGGRLARCAARGWRTPTWAGCSSTPTAGRKARYAPDLIADPLIRFVDRTFVLWVTLGLLVPFAPRLRPRRNAGRGADAACSGAAWCGSWSCITSPQHQLPVPLLRPPPLPPATSRATLAGCRCSRSASLAQQPSRLPPRPPRRSDAGRSTSGSAGAPPAGAGGPGLGRPALPGAPARPSSRWPLPPAPAVLVGAPQARTAQP